MPAGPSSATQPARSNSASPCSWAVGTSAKNGVRVAVIGQVFPYVPIAHPRHFVADWTFGIQERELQKVVDEVRAKGARAVVLGRSQIVGRPMAQLLLGADCTVTIAHSRTRDLAAECARADIVVAAVGRAEMVRADWVKPSATVIDVGINRLADGRLVGDVAFDEVAAVAGAITPVPGGVGPMTIACLLENTLDAALARRG